MLRYNQFSASDSRYRPDQPCLVHALTPQTLLVATDASALHVYDLRGRPAYFSFGHKPQQTHQPHNDYISSISSLPPTKSSTSGTSKQWVTTGATTLAVTDLRRGVLSKSEDQEEELLSSAFVSGLPTKHGRASGEKIIVGGAGGVLTLWEKGWWEDQDERITLDKSAGGGESLDAIVPLPDNVEKLPGTNIAVGMGNGRVKIVGLSPNKVVGELLHDDFDGVVTLGVDASGRLLSGGGRNVKIWMPREAALNEDRDEVDGSTAKKRRARSESDDEGDSDRDGDDSDDEPAPIQRKKRRKKGKGARRTNGHGNLLAFQGLD